MHCCVCKREGKTTLWGGVGTRNFRLKTLTDHVKSTDHRHAFAAEAKGQMWIDVQVKSNLVKSRSAITLASKTCYWLITQEVANCKYKQIVEFLQEQQMPDALYLNRGANAPYDSTNTFNNLGLSQRRRGDKVETTVEAVTIRRDRHR